MGTAPNFPIPYFFNFSSFVEKQNLLDTYYDFLALGAEYDIFRVNLEDIPGY